MNRAPQFASFCILLITTSILHAADPRADFLKLIDRPRVPLAAEVQNPSTSSDAAPIHFTYASDAKNRVPGIILKPAASGRRPVVIALHGTGGTKNDQLPLMKQLVEKGFIAVAIDAPYHGERSKAGKGSAEYQDAIVQAYHEQKEHPFFFDTVWDVMRLIDYLETRDDIDPKRIGLYGVSKGGIETYLTTAVDSRVAVAVPCIGVQSFRWALDNNTWKNRIETVQNAFDKVAAEEKIQAPDAAFVRKFYDRVSPGIYGQFDGPAMLPLIAPRPLMTINGDSDMRTPLPALKECTDAAQKLYHEAKADDHFLIRIQDKTGHKVNPDSQLLAVEWFAKWLKP